MKLVGVAILGVLMIAGAQIETRATAEAPFELPAAAESCSPITFVCARVDALHTGTYDTNDNYWSQITFHVYGYHSGSSIYGRIDNPWGEDDECWDSEYCETHASTDVGAVYNQGCWTGRAWTDHDLGEISLPGSMAADEDCY